MVLTRRRPRRKWVVLLEPGRYSLSAILRTASKVSAPPLRELFQQVNSEKSARRSRSEKGLRKRIWWTLYTRDRAVAAAFGRPLHINLDDCTVEPLTESDFAEYDEQFHLEHPPDTLQVQFFMQYIQLCRLMEAGLCLRLSARSTQANRVAKAAQCEIGLNEWLQSCPGELCWRQSRHNFWSAVLHSTFKFVCLLLDPCR